MSYTLAIATEAQADLVALIDSLPEDRRARALPAVFGALQPLAANPRLASRSSKTLDRPTFLLHFVIDDVHYHWAATFAFGQDEQTLVITHLYRPAM